jgi:hypothetical protein
MAALPCRPVRICLFSQKALVDRPIRSDPAKVDFVSCAPPPHFQWFALNAGFGARFCRSDRSRAETERRMSGREIGEANEFKIELLHLRNS